MTQHFEKAFSPHQQNIINLVNNLETWMVRNTACGRGEQFAAYLHSQGIGVEATFHRIWRATPTREKHRLLSACSTFLYSDLVARKMIREECSNTPDLAELIRIDLGLFEEWIELGQLSWYVSQSRTMARDLGKITADQIATSAVAIIDGKSERGYILHPAREVFVARLATDPLVQAVDNLIANSHDAIDPLHAIGMFGSGEKVLESLLNDETFSEVRVVSKTLRGVAMLLRLRKSLASRTYLNILPLSQYPMEDVAAIDGDCGSSVEIVGLDLSPSNIQHIHDSIAFRSGILGRGVQLNIEDQREETCNEEQRFWGRQHVCTQWLGSIDVEIRSDRIRVSDTGKGMTQDQLYKLFVPRQGTKTLTLCASTEALSVLKEKGFLETRMRADGASWVKFMRRGEVLSRIHLDPTDAALFPGEVLLECDTVLRPAGEGRGQSGIFVDSNLALIIEVLTNKILGEESAPCETKAQLLSTLLLALKYLSHEQKGASLETDASRTIKIASLSIVKKSAALLSDLSEKYFLIPGGRAYQKLRQRPDKPFFPIAKDILECSQYFFVSDLGERLDREQGVWATDGYRVFAVDLACSHARAWDSAFFSQLIQEQEEMLPVLVDPDLRLVFVDKTYWAQYARLTHLEADGQATQEEMRQVRLARAALEGLMNKRVKTCYEVQGVHEIHRPITLKARQTAATGTLCEKKSGWHERAGAPDSRSLGTVYLDDIWPLIDTKLVQNSSEQQMLMEVLTRHTTFEQDGLGWIEEIHYLAQGTEQIVIANYHDIFIYRIDENGELHKTNGSIPQEKGSEYAPLRIGERNGEKVLILVDTKNNRIGWYSFAELASGVKLNPPTHQIIGSDVELVSSGLVQYTVLFPSGSPLLIMSKGGLSLDGSHALAHFRLNSNSDFVESPDNEVQTDTIHWTEAIHGEEGILAGFYTFDGRKSTPSVAHFRLSGSGRLLEIDRIDVSIKHSFFRDWRLICLSGKWFLIISGEGGYLYPLSLDEKGQLHQYPTIHLPESRNACGDYYKVTDVQGDWILCTNSANGQVRLLRLDPETGESREHYCQMVYVQAHTHFTAYFTMRQKRQSVLYHSHANPHGYLDIVESDPNPLRPRVSHEYQKRVELINRFLRARTSEVFLGYPEEALDTVAKRVLRYTRTLDLEYAVSSWERLAQSQLLQGFMSKEMRSWVNDLTQDERAYWTSHSLEFILSLAGLSTVPRCISHLEWASLGHHFPDERLAHAYYALLDAIDIEATMPLVEDRMKFYHVLSEVVDASGEVSAQTIDRIAVKCQQLIARDMLQQVVDTLFEAYATMKLQASRTKFSALLTPDKKPYLRFLLSDAELVRQVHEEITIPYNRNLPVSGLSYLGKILGASSVQEMEQICAQDYGMTLEAYITQIPDLSEFDQDWRIAVHFCGINGIEQREIIQNADDAIRRRKYLYGEDLEGSITYNYYTQRVNGHLMFIQDITDNGCGMSDRARLAFAVSGLSDKKAYGSAQSGAFGVGFCSNYKENDLVIVDTVRIIDRKTMRKGATRDVYRVERSESGYSHHLVQVGKWEDDTIDQQTALGTRLRLCKDAARGLPDVDALIAQSNARKFGWLTGATSRERHPDTIESAVPIHIYETRNDDGEGWKLKEIEMNYRLVQTLQLDEIHVVSLYEGDGSVPAHIALDGRWMSEITADVTEFAHPTLLTLFENYRLAVNLHGFTPTLDRGSVLEKEAVQVAVAQLLTTFASYKLLTDPHYQPKGMPVDFREKPDYLEIFTGLPVTTQSMAKRLNNGAVLDRVEALWLAERPTDTLNFLLAAFEHVVEGKRQSVLLQRIVAFIRAYKYKLAGTSSKYRDAYTKSLDQTYALVRVVASDCSLQELEQQDFPSWFRSALSRINANEHDLMAQRVTNVTHQYKSSDLYQLFEQLYAEIGIAGPQIIRDMQATGHSFGQGIVWLKEGLMNSEHWPDPLIHEGAHEVEQLLLSLGIGSQFTHQQDGNFALAYKLVAWKFLNFVLR